MSIEMINFFRLSWSVHKDNQISELDQMLQWMVSGQGWTDIVRLFELTQRIELHHT